MQEELTRLMRGVEADPQMKLDGEMILKRGDDTATSGEGNLVPKFSLYASQRTYTYKGHKVSAQVVNIRAAKEDQSCLTYLLSEAVRVYTGQKIEFMEQGIDDEQYYRELGHHIRFVNEDMLILLVGVHKDALQYETQGGQTIEKILMEKTEARSLE